MSPGLADDMNRRQEALEQALVSAMERKDKKEVVFLDMGGKLAETGLDKFIDCNVSLWLFCFHFLYGLLVFAGDAQHQCSERTCYSSQKVQSEGSNPCGLVCRLETVCVSVKASFQVDILAGLQVLAASVCGLHRSGL